MPIIPNITADQAVDIASVTKFFTDNLDSDKTAAIDYSDGSFGFDCLLKNAVGESTIVSVFINQSNPSSYASIQVDIQNIVLVIFRFRSEAETLFYNAQQVIKFLNLEITSDQFISNIKLERKNIFDVTAASTLDMPRGRVQLTVDFIAKYIEYLPQEYISNIIFDGVFIVKKKPTAPSDFLIMLSDKIHKKFKETVGKISGVYVYSSTLFGSINYQTAGWSSVRMNNDTANIRLVADVFTESENTIRRVEPALEAFSPEELANFSVEDFSTLVGIAKL